MDEEEKKLQITLAKLQTDVQIGLAMCFGFVVLFGAGIIVFLQLYFSPHVNSLTKDSFCVVIIFYSIMMVYFARKYGRMVNAKRHEMDKLS